MVAIRTSSLILFACLSCPAQLTQTVQVCGKLFAFHWSEVLGEYLMVFTVKVFMCRLVNLTIAYYEAFPYGIQKSLEREVGKGSQIWR